MAITLGKPKDAAKATAGANSSTGASSKPKPKAKAGKYPTKTRMNLAQKEKTDFTLQKAALPIALTVLFVAIIAKFAIFDVINRAVSAENENAPLQTELTALQSKLSSYSDVAEEYKLYSYGYMTEEEQAVVDPVDAIGIVDEMIKPQASVSSVTIADNKVSVTFSGMTLAQVGVLQAQIKALPSVSDVAVYTADTIQDEATGAAKVVGATMVITLHKVDEAAVTSNTGPATTATASSTSSSTTSTTAATASSSEASSEPSAEAASSTAEAQAASTDEAATETAEGGAA